MAKILLIDDDKDILRLLEYALRRASHTVLTSVDGTQGLAMVEAERPDLIVADVMMPRMTGYDFCRQVRARPNLADIPIVIFSARFQPIDRETAMEAGATDYLPKTASPDALIKRVTELLPNSGAAVGAGHTVIGLFSLRGGTGVTSLAVNLSLGLVRLHPKQPVLLVDLAPVGGHAALLLGLRPTSSVAHILATSGGNFSLSAIKSHLLRHSSGLYLLPSALSPEHQLALNDNRLPQLITTLKKGLPFTILDIPPAVGPGHTAMLRSFDKLVLVVSPDMPSLQSAALALQSLARMGLADNKIALVVNQVTPQGALPLDTIQKALKRQVLLNVPYDPEMIKAVNSGKPLLLGSSPSPAAGAIARLAQELVDRKS
jgi:pilus assembly protein CpaE